MFWGAEPACWERKFFGCPARITPESRLRLSWKDNFAKKGRPDSIWAERNISHPCLQAQGAGWRAGSPSFQGSRAAQDWRALPAKAQVCRRNGEIGRAHV